MYMRFVRLKVKQDRMADFRRFYDDRIITALQGTAGCLFASLLQTTSEDDECVSLTLWSSQQAAETYEASGLYDELLDESDEYLAEASEWRARLTGDPGRSIPRLQDPDVEAFPVDVAALSDPVADEAPPHLFLRIVAVRVDAGRFEELRDRYNEEVVPALLATPGCRAVFLVESLQASNRALSVTVWDSEEHALRYEMSGAFDTLTSRLSEFFSGLYQWKLSLTPSREGDSITGQDLDVSGYRLVTGRRLDSEK
jgi:quinol monooxygenase YgiN